MFKRITLFVSVLITFNLFILSSLPLYGQVPTQGLVAYYPFNGDANDYSGNGNHGNTNSGCSWVLGQNGEACSFDGTGYISVPNSTSLQSPTSALSIAFWIYIDQWNDGWASVLAKSNNSEYGQYSAEINTPAGANFWTGSNVSIYSHQLTTGRWYHVAFTWDGAQKKFYVDGNLKDVQNYSGLITPDDLPLEIGRHTPGTTEYFTGKLDNLVIYDRALTIDEVNMLSALGDGLVAHYPFNGNTNDESENGYNGNNYGAQFVENRFNEPNKALFLDGVAYSDYVQIDNFPNDFPNVTVTAWIKAESIGGVGEDAKIIFDTWYDSFTNPFRLWMNNGNLSFTYESSGSYAEANIPFSYLSAWHFVCGKRFLSGSDIVMELWLDGILMNSTYTTLPIPSANGQSARIGANYSYNQNFHGTLDDIRIYNRALSETEISDLYHENGWGGRELNTIIITHGFTGEGVPPLNPIMQTKWEDLRWQFAMAYAVSDNRDIYLIRKGNVYAIEATYSQFATIDIDSTIDYVINNYGVPLAINPEKDNVFIFDWTLESAINVHGFAEAAGDVLAATLVKLAKEDSSLLSHLHFIGHSRGCVVNSEAIQRLIYWADNGILPGSITLDSEIHMTTLDPHPAGHWSNRWLTGDFVYMDDDRVNSFNIGVAGWKSGNYLTKYIDNYFETNLYLLPPYNPFIGLDSYPGLNLDPPSKNDLSSKLPTNGEAHQLVHTWYFGTINTIANEDEFGEGPNIPRTEWYNSNLGITEGFYYSRNRQGPLSDIASVQNELKDVNSDSKLFSSGFILNGDFTDFERDTLNNNFRYNFPGWSYQDGVSSHLGGFFNPAARLSNSYPDLVHNSLYIPESSTECIFRMRVEAPPIPYSIKDELEIYLDDILIKSIPINSFELNYQWMQTNIPEIFKGKTCNLTFKLKKNNQSNDSRVDIDDIGLRYNTRISSTVACPVDFHIYDNLGNHTGPITDSTYVEEIPGSEYYIYEDSTGDKIKTVYLDPIEGIGSYTFKIESRDTTALFRYEIEDYTDTTRGTITYQFDEVAIEPNTIATCSLDVSTQIPTLGVDINGDGTSDTTYTPAVITAVENDESQEYQLPKGFILNQNYPNPFNPSTTISYSLPSNSLVQLKIFNILGQEIATLVNEEKPSGNYQVVFDASNLSSGVYFYKIQAGDFVQTNKMILVK